MDCRNNNSINCVIAKMYEPSEDFAFSYLVPFFFILSFVVTITSMYIKAGILEGKLDWESTKCVPKYLFISGLITKQKGKNVLQSTFDNFKECVNQVKTIKINTNLRNEFRDLLILLGLDPEEANHSSIEDIKMFIRHITGELV